MADPETSKDAAESEPALPPDEASGGLIEPPEPEVSAEEPQAEVLRAPEPDPASKAPAPAPARRGRGGFVGTVLGGVLAALVGFGAARYLVPEGWPFGTPVKVTDTLGQRLDAANAALAALKTQVADLGKAAAAAQAAAGAAQGLAGRVDQEAAALGALKDQVTKADAALKQSLSGLNDRLTALEKVPLATGTAGGSADAAVLESLRAQLEEQRRQNAALADQIKSVADAANARIDKAQTEAQALKAEADATARAALARAALTRVQTALTLGGGFASSLADLTAQGIKVPDVLANAAAAGVPTQLQLEQAFPAAARAALDASVKATMGTGVGERLAAFLRTETGLRSLTPRPGKDPDAVLSRAEADLRTGKLSDSLNEIGTLPVQGQAAMADWLVLAKSRLDALTAAETLAQSLGK